MHDQYGTSGLHVLGLITGPGFGKETLKRYMDNNEVHYSMVVMDNKTMYETIGAHSVPTFLLINKKGTVAGYFRGYSEMNLKLIEQQTKTLLAE
jgi:protein-disulfide isomerase-like protein with CxxC motif